MQGRHEGDDMYSEFFPVWHYEDWLIGFGVGDKRVGGHLADCVTATELRIHEHTERGDNDTIKMPNGQKVVIDGKRCDER